MQCWWSYKGSSKGGGYYEIKEGYHIWDTCSGYTYGSPLCITFTGSGKLAVNKKKSFANGIEIQYNDAASKIVFAKKVKVDAYAGDSGYPVYVSSSASDVKKAIVKKGGSMTECKAGEDGEFYCDAAKFVKK